MTKAKVSNVQMKRLIEESNHLFAYEGKLTIALQKIDQALRISPTNTEALVIKGRVLFHSDRTEEALRCFDRAISIDSACGEAFLERARILYAVRQENKKALREVRRALARAGRARWVKVEALRLQGHILAALEQDDQAIASYRAALRLKPKDAHTRRALSDTLLTVGQPAKALRELDRALQILNAEKTPNHLDLGFTAASKAEALNALGRHFEALRVIEIGLKQVRNRISREGLQVLRNQTRRLLREDGAKLHKRER